MPDLYKLEEEINEFSEVSSEKIRIYASPDCSITLLYDVYLNQKREELRGTDKHGSCGMGIWEATKRTAAGYKLTLGDIASLSADDIAAKIKCIEDEYVALKIDKFGIGERLNLDTVKYASILKSALENNVTLVSDEKNFFESYDNVIFEGGQGLLLDTAREELWPHTTCSRTNITNPVKILESSGLKLAEAVYVTRSYLTRHGAGPFEEDTELCFADETNKPNPWQGAMRFGKHSSASDLIGRAVKDYKDNCSYEITASMFVTQLDLTSDTILTRDGDIAISDFGRIALESGMDKLYLARSRYSKNVSTL